MTRSYCTERGRHVRFADICDALNASGIEDFRFEARVLIEEFCGEMSEDKDYTSSELLAAIKRRCDRYPLQYIIGEWEFYGLRFKVNENCLIPRADTETVVETARKLLPVGARFADLCAGSGCIGIALLHARPDTTCDAVELYPETLEIAKENSRINTVSDRYFPVLADVLEGDCISGEYDAIISNPPYIRSDILKTLSDEVKREPQAALDGGDDGLVFYRGILDLYTKNLREHGKFIFEIGYDQAEEIRLLAAERGMGCEVIRDLCGNDRVAIIGKELFA